MKNFGGMKKEMKITGEHKICRYKVKNLGPSRCSEVGIQKRLAFFGNLLVSKFQAFTSWNSALLACRRTLICWILFSSKICVIPSHKWICKALFYLLWSVHSSFHYYHSTIIREYFYKFSMLKHFIVFSLKHQLYWNKQTYRCKLSSIANSTVAFRQTMRYSILVDDSYNRSVLERYRFSDNVFYSSSGRSVLSGHNVRNEFAS